MEINLKFLDPFVNWVRPKIVWLIRFKTLFFFITLIGTALYPILTGFWVFAQKDEDAIKNQYAAAIESQNEFEEQVDLLAVWLQGDLLPENASIIYSKAASEYVRSVQTVSNSLPETEEALIDYSDAISNLGKYYEMGKFPKPGTKEYIKIYGSLQKDLDKFIKSRDHYLSAVNTRLHSYRRFVWQRLR